jgi:hypothetical protein
MKKDKKTYIQLNRNEDVLDLLKHHKEFILLTQIALRAKRNNHKIGNLSKNQALIGDYKTIGLTEQSYRSAKSNIQKWGLATFHPTNKGTIATLTDTTIYDINAEKDNEQTNSPVTSKPTVQQRTSNEQATTNNNINKEKKENNINKENIKKKNFKKYTLSDFENEVKNFTEFIEHHDDFINYWTEKDSTGKMKFQLNKTWETKLRLSKWARNNFNNINSNSKLTEQSLIKKYGKDSIEMAKRIYIHYPNKYGGLAAIESIAKVLPQVEYDKLLKYVKKFAEKQKLQNKEPQFIVSAKKWFEEGGWIDIEADLIKTETDF